MRGESVALLGESGAGKSTLLNLIAGLEPFDEGELQVVGQRLPREDFDPDASAELRRRHIGFVFQAFHLLPHLSVVQNVALPLLLIGNSADQALSCAGDFLRKVDLSKLSSAQPLSLSGGEQQRVALARSLVHEPALLLADEPTGNLDPDSAERALGLMQSVVRESGSALVLVTHSDQASKICDRRVRLIDGQLKEARD